MVLPISKRDIVFASEDSKRWFYEAISQTFQVASVLLGSNVFEILNMAQF